MKDIERYLVIPNTLVHIDIYPRKSDDETLATGVFDKAAPIKHFIAKHANETTDIAVTLFRLNEPEFLNPITNTIH